MGTKKRSRGRAGRAIRAYCATEGISQAELARRIGYTRQALTGVVRGSPPGREMIEALVKASSGAITAADLLGIDGEGERAA